MWALLNLRKRMIGRLVGFLLSLPIACFAAYPPSLIVVNSSTNPATFSLKYFAFDSVPEASSYRIYVTPIAPTRIQLTATNFQTWTTTNTVPHLIYGQTYWIQVQTLTANTNSDLSPPLVWPQPLTNVAVLSMAQSDSFTNWQSFGPKVVVTNPLGLYLIKGPMTNNIDAYQIKE